MPHTVEKFKAFHVKQKFCYLRFIDALNGNEQKSILCEVDQKWKKKSNNRIHILFIVK